MEKRVLFTLVLLFSLSIISAIPGIPHQFYGEVRVNDELIKDNNIISGVVDGEEYSTITKNGAYGSYPNLLLVEDILGDARGKTITFYVGGMQAGEFTFQNNAQTNLDFSLTTICGDGFCLGDETCSRCSEDCGECSTPTIFIESPIDKQTYEDTKIDINVYSDQEIQIWMYSLNKATPIVFEPNITLTLLDEDYDLEILGMNSAYRTGSEEVSFSVDLPYDYCGDSECAGEETCSNCNADCGACPPPASSGGSGGGSSGGGGGGGFFSSLIKKITNPSDDTDEVPKTETPVEVPEEIVGETPEPAEEVQENTEFRSRITGAVIGFSKTSAGKIISLVVLLIVVLGIILLSVHLKNKKKKSPVSEYIEPEKENNEPVTDFE